MALAAPTPLPQCRLRRAVRTAVLNLDPGAFAFVMATGIVSSALDRDGTRGASAALLVIGLSGYGVLLLGNGWRLLRWRRRLLADAVGPSGFAFLTAVAASSILADRMAADGHRTAAAVLLTVGVLGWLLLGYGIPLALVAAARRRPSLDQVNGTWFLWVVATQSVAVAAVAFDGLTPAAHGFLPEFASVCWAIGLMQYVLVAPLVLSRMLVRPMAPEELIPAYWVFMGAAAISVLAGTALLRLPAADRLLPTEVTSALCFVLWSFATWLVPLLIALGAWRYLARHVPLRFASSLWSLVFPVGMYGVATRQLGSAIGVSWLITLGEGEAWLAAAVWAVVFLAMLAALTRSLCRTGATQ
ncbi:tellurite resistance/C4-dicarboxylate transporter family protein [Streptomyces sp. NPDC101194]|uniref:tellurite resistance/C4-dicarboxylate transporter family protein n=1 Tax=Streptomyces sp. NPDC101194 TaxID=3366127 RepID=UPI00382890B9